MGEEDGANEAIASTSNTVNQTAKNRASENGDQEGEEKKTKPQTVPFYKLFAFADSKDYTMMVIGTIGAMGNGVCMPLMTILMGELINSFGQNQNTDKTLQAVINVALKFVYLAIGAGIAAFLRKIDR
ncbi:unnamed protein product [Rhodiola kirilowii]